MWSEIGNGIYIHRFASYDLTIGLIVGADACLLVDTRDSLAHGRELADAVRTVTPAAWTVVNTHAHFDHYLGNGAFVPADIWALDRCREVIDRTGAEQLERFGDGATPLVEPNRTFAPPEHVLDIGGRRVSLRHLGRGHTDGDIVIRVDDVVFAGDLVEEGAPPSFDDSFPLDWPATVEALLELVSGPVVPGHGEVVDTEFVRDQLDLLRTVAAVARDGAGPDQWRRTGLPEQFGRIALTRARLQL